jgi:hypothetical protein
VYIVVTGESVDCASDTEDTRTLSGTAGSWSHTPIFDMSESYLQKKVIRPFISLLKQGLDPSRLSLALAVGAAIGAFI